MLMEPKIHLRQAMMADELFVLQLEELCMRDYAKALWGSWKADMDKFVPGLHRIIVAGGIDVGCIETAVHADHVYLDKLYLLPSHQRQAIGAGVLRSLVAEAKGLSLPLRLSVLITNPAQAFYRREGLRELSRDAERISLETDYLP